MPKSGTSSLADFFRCGKYKTSHQLCRRHITCGTCMLRNQRRNLSLLRGCDSFDAFTQLDVEYALHDDDCYMPQQHENVLVKLHVEYPDSVFILNNRNPLRWATSVRDWQMSRRFVECNFTEPRILMSDVYLTAWYRRHQTFIRNFARVYHHRLIEVDIENATSYHELASAANISLSCVSDQSHTPAASAFAHPFFTNEVEQDSTLMMTSTTTQHHSNNSVPLADDDTNITTFPPQTLKQQMYIPSSPKFVVKK